MGAVPCRIAVVSGRSIKHPAFIRLPVEFLPECATTLNAPRTWMRHELDSELWLCYKRPSKTI